MKLAIILIIFIIFIAGLFIIQEKRSVLTENESTSKISGTWNLVLNE